MKEDKNHFEKRPTDFFEIRRLPITILDEAQAVNKEAVKPGVYMATQRADDEFLIISHHDPGNYYLATVLFFLFALFGFYSAPDVLEITIFCILLILLSIFCLVYGYSMPKKEIILDRMNGLFTMPGFLWGKPITFDFSTTHAHILITGWPPLAHLGVKRPNHSSYMKLALDQQIQTWSLMVWYMDRNRPLPPGTAFDHYRQKDFERRKKAGFPPPLYDSVIPTPEDSRDTPNEKLSDPNYNYYH